MQVQLQLSLNDQFTIVSKLNSYNDCEGKVNEYWTDQRCDDRPYEI